LASRGAATRVSSSSVPIPIGATAAGLCDPSSSRICGQIRAKEYPEQPLTHDPRIKAAVIVDPLALLFTADSLQGIKVPIQLWASELGGDGVLPHTVAAVDSGLPVKHEYHVVPNSAHFAFLAPCPPALTKARPELCTDVPGFDRGAFHQQLDAEVLAFFRAQLGDR
jgi:predicted dienelactone hydrolase